MKIAFTYVTDERGFELTVHSAASVALSQVPPCPIHIFCYRFEPAQASQLEAALGGLGVRLTFDHISDETVEHHKTHGHVTTPTLLKLAAIERLMSRYDRIAYLDNDILVFDPLPLATIDFGSAPLAAVIDMDISKSGVHRQVHWGRSAHHSPALQSYFNAGFLVFDSDILAAGRYSQRYREALEAHNAGCDFKLCCTSADQCALNVAFENEWVKLPLSYNMQAGARYTDAWQTAKVRHYCGTRKFLPVAWFRNDARDIRLLNRVRSLIGRPIIEMPTLHEVTFRLNIIRRRNSDFSMRCLIQTVEMSSGVVSA